MYLAKAGCFQPVSGTIRNPTRRAPPPLQCKVAEKRTTKCAPDESLRIGAVGYERVADTADDDPRVVDDWSQRRNGEDTLRVLDGGKQCSENEEDLSREHDAGEPCGRGKLVGGELGIEHLDDGRSGEPPDDDESEDADRDRADDRRQCFPATGFVVVGQVFREDRDEGDREEATGEEVVQEVGERGMPRHIGR